MMKIGEAWGQAWQLIWQWFKADKNDIEIWIAKWAIVNVL